MIVGASLTEAGAAKFNAWFDRVAKPAVRRQVVAMEVCDRALDARVIDSAMTYELGQQYTATGRPELFHLDDADVEFDTAEDE